MSHHGPGPDDNRKFEIPKSRDELMRSLLDTTGFRGATGAFPEGKLKEDDEGGIQFAIGSEGDKVILDFGTPVKWVGMSAQQAADLASTLLAKAREVGRKQGETITLTLGK